MKLSQFSVYHPIFTVMIFLIVIILGLVSFTRLPIDLMPDITYPTLSLSTSYGNASPEEMEELITRPIEEALAAVPGVEEISSPLLRAAATCGFPSPGEPTWKRLQTIFETAWTV